MNEGTRSLILRPEVVRQTSARVGICRLDDRGRPHFAAVVLRVLVVLLSLLGCGRTEPLSETIAFDAGSTRDAGVDAGTSRDAGSLDAGMNRDAGAPTSCTNAPGPGAGRRCQRRLRLDSLSRSSASCFVDVRIDLGEEGVLDWECDRPTGPAEVRFARARFTGLVNADQVDVCFGSEFDWSDGCRWTSAQALRGSLTDLTLQLTYAEAPLSRVGCQTPCAASGVVTVLSP